jgi:hypothetical protein
MATNTEAAALKARRAAARTAGDGPPVTPVAVGKDEPARREKLLFHPDEPRAVAEATGSLYGTGAGEAMPGFTIAEVDAYETFTPDRCTTPVTRARWTKGQHVPTEVYEKHMAEQKAPERVADGAAS